MSIIVLCQFYYFLLLKNQTFSPFLQKERATVFLIEKSKESFSNINIK